MAFTAYVDVAKATHAECMLALKDNLVASGFWTLVDSGDGQLADGTPQIYGNGTDVVTSAARGDLTEYIPNSIVNRKAWFQLEAPDGTQLIFQRSSANNGADLWQCRRSVSGFTIGTPAANTTPFSVDPVYFLADSTATGRAFWGTSGAQRLDMMVGDADEGYAFYAFSRAPGASLWGGGMFLDALTDTEVGDEDPAIVMCICTGSVFTQGGVLMNGRTGWAPQSANPRPFGWQREVASASEPRAASHFLIFPTSVTTDDIVTGLNPYDGTTLDAFGPAYWCTTNKPEETAETLGAPRGRIKGASRLIRFLASPSVTAMDTGLGKTVVCQGAGRYWFPWDGTTTPSDIGAASTARTLMEHPIGLRSFAVVASVGGGDDVTAPVVDNFIPTPGTPLDRNAQVQFDVTDESGSFAAILVTVRYHETGGHEVVWDGDQFSYQYGSSSRTAITNGYRFVLRRLGGWPYQPTIRCMGIDAAGNL